MRNMVDNDAPILIVGAGAMGVACGYHLQLGGSRVTYLVRPGRAAEYAAPKTIYCYDDGAFKHFSGFAVTERIDGDVLRFGHVLLTLDGATARSAHGASTLRSLGAALRSTDASLIVGGVGFALEEHVLACTGLQPSRVLSGTMAMLCHQRSSALPLPEPPDLSQQTDFGYRHASGETGFILAGTNAGRAARFAEVYGRSGLSSCRVLPQRLFHAMINAAFPFFVASEIAGWPDVDTLVRQRSLWTLCCRAQSEIAALPGNGWAGWLLSWALTPSRRASMQRKVERAALPLDYQAFNRFHHGGKVRAQDIQILRDCLAWGREHARTMPALTALLARRDELEKSGTAKQSLTG